MLKDNVGFHCKKKLRGPNVLFFSSPTATPIATTSSCQFCDHKPLPITPTTSGTDIPVRRWSTRSEFGNRDFGRNLILNRVSMGERMTINSELACYLPPKKNSFTNNCSFPCTWSHVTLHLSYMCTFISSSRAVDTSGGFLDHTPEMACKVIVATACLHNVARERKLPLPPDADTDDDGFQQEMERFPQPQLYLPPGPQNYARRTIFIQRNFEE